MRKTEIENIFSLYIGRKITCLRSRNKITQKMLADYLKVSPQQVQKYEKGINEISLFNLMKLCSFFHVTLFYFLSDEDTPDFNSTIQEVVFKINQLDTQKVRLFLDLTTAFSEKK